MTVRWVRVEPGPTASWRLLDASERTRADRLRIPADRCAYIAAHALLRAMLSDAQPGIAPGAWRFIAGRLGKPALDPAHGAPDLQFSLSHTRGMAACAVGYHDAIGVDVEALSPVQPAADLARRFFAGPEAALIANLPPARQNEMFIRLWTLKEAYLKATGTGVEAGMDGFAFSLDPLSIAFPAGRDCASAWQFAELAPGPDHRLALAIRRPVADPVRLDIAQSHERILS